MKCWFSNRDSSLPIVFFLCNERAGKLHKKIERVYEKPVYTMSEGDLRCLRRTIA